MKLVFSAESLSKGICQKERKAKACKIIGFGFRLAECTNDGVKWKQWEAVVHLFNYLKSTVKRNSFFSFLTRIGKLNYVSP